MVKTAEKAERREGREHPQFDRTICIRHTLDTPDFAIRGWEYSPFKKYFEQEAIVAHPGTPYPGTTLPQVKEKITSLAAHLSSGAQFLTPEKLDGEAAYFQNEAIKHINRITTYAVEKNIAQPLTMNVPQISDFDDMARHFNSIKRDGFYDLESTDGHTYIVTYNIGEYPGDGEESPRYNKWTDVPEDTQGKLVLIDLDRLFSEGPEFVKDPLTDHFAAKAAESLANTIRYNLALHEVGKLDRVTDLLAGSREREMYQHIDGMFALGEWIRKTTRKRLRTDEDAGGIIWLRNQIERTINMPNMTGYSFVPEMYYNHLSHCGAEDAKTRRRAEKALNAVRNIRWNIERGSDSIFEDLNEQDVTVCGLGNFIDPEFCRIVQTRFENAKIRAVGIPEAIDMFLGAEQASDYAQLLKAGKAHLSAETSQALDEVLAGITSANHLVTPDRYQELYDRFRSNLYWALLNPKPSEPPVDIKKVLRSALIGRLKPGLAEDGLLLSYEDFRLKPEYSYVEDLLSAAMTAQAIREWESHGNAQMAAEARNKIPELKSQAQYQIAFSNERIERITDDMVAVNLFCRRNGIDISTLEKLAQMTGIRQEHGISNLKFRMMVNLLFFAKKGKIDLDSKPLKMMVSLAYHDAGITESDYAWLKGALGINPEPVRRDRPDQ